MTLKSRKVLQDMLFMHKSINDLIERDISEICYIVPYVRCRSKSVDILSVLAPWAGSIKMVNRICAREDTDFFNQNVKLL